MNLDHRTEGGWRREGGWEESGQGSRVSVSLIKLMPAELLMIIMVQDKHPLSGRFTWALISRGGVNTNGRPARP